MPMDTRRFVPCLCLLAAAYAGGEVRNLDNSSIPDGNVAQAA